LVEKPPKKFTRIKAQVVCKKCGIQIGEVFLHNWEEGLALLISEMKRCPNCGKRLSKNPTIEVYLKDG